MHLHVDIWIGRACSSSWRRLETLVAPVLTLGCTYIKSRDRRPKKIPTRGCTIYLNTIYLIIFLAIRSMQLFNPHNITRLLYLASKDMTENKSELVTVGEQPRSTSKRGEPANRTPLGSLPKSEPPPNLGPLDQSAKH